MCKARKNIQATDKKTMGKWVKQNGVRNFMHLDTHDVTYTPPNTTQSLGSEGRMWCERLNQD